MYFKFKPSSFLSSRDAIFEFNTEVDKNGRYITIIQTKERNGIPVPNNTVRMDYWKGLTTQDRGNDSYYIYFEVMDLKMNY